MHPFTGVTWNANGLIMTNTHNRKNIIKDAIRLMIKHDWCVITDTHATDNTYLEAKHKAATRGYTSYWTHLSSRTGGVAIFIKDSFLKKFEDVKWDHVRKGRVGRLTLINDQNEKLCINGVYMPTGDDTEFNDTVEVMANHCNDKAHNIIIGDHNFIEHAEDRYIFRNNMGHTTPDTKLVVEWRTRMNARDQWVEWYPPAMTHVHTDWVTAGQKLLQYGHCRSRTLGNQRCGPYTIHSLRP